MKQRRGCFFMRKLKLNVFFSFSLVICDNKPWTDLGADPMPDSIRKIEHFGFMVLSLLLINPLVVLLLFQRPRLD
jgi:hypothetical protein